MCWTQEPLFTVHLGLVYFSTQKSAPNLSAVALLVDISCHCFDLRLDLGLGLEWAILFLFFSSK